MIDKDVLAVAALAPKREVKARPVRKNLESVQIYEANRKTKVGLYLMGMWTAQMPPYNLARLVALTRKSGYYTHCKDYNIESYYYMMLEDADLADGWNVANFWWWKPRNYYEKVHPWYQDILDGYIEEILENNLDIIGFSVYESNLQSTNYVAEEIKKLKPEVTIIYGGPECMEHHFVKPYFVDYYFVGESEGNVLEFLNNWEEGKKPEGDGPIGVMFGQKRINLDELPFPDYSDFPVDMYTSKDVVCTELSRGCVARCTYCTEVYYWKFRDRDSMRVVEEIEHQYHTYGTRFIYFADSLMNGNINEFRRFCELLAEKKLPYLHWWGYARADGRMDDEFYELIYKAGGRGFNYGFETGSDRVLKAINKKNTRKEIESNIRSADKYGVKTSSCWVIGAPGEEITDWGQSLTLFWNHRKRLYAISPGPGLQPNQGSAYDDRERFNMNKPGHDRLGGWWTLDKRNTFLHRYIRIKTCHIWLNICNRFDGQIINSWEYGDVGNHFKIEFDNERTNEDLKYEEDDDFDYNIIKTNLGDFADTSMNEVFALLRTIYKAKGGYELTLKFKPEIDKQDFGDLIRNWEFDAEIYFKIDKDGNYKVKNMYAFKDLQDVDDSWDYNHVYEDFGKW